MFDLTGYTDSGLLLMRIMTGAIYIDSGYLDLKNPDARSKNIGLPKGFTIFLAVAEVAGGIAVILGFLQQLAALGLILIMLGAIQKKMVAWKTGFWGTGSSLGWYYELTLISMLLVILFTNGGGFVLTR